MASIPGQGIFGLFETHRCPVQSDQSSVRLPQVIGRDELDPYDHKPIDTSKQIRLVKLLPPKKSTTERNSMEPLRCTIHTVFLAQVINYEALSYTWGKMERDLPISIQVDGDQAGEEQALFITPELMMALKRLRLPSTPRILWIDQLSIDQETEDEKGPQIQLMKDIFRNAQRVIVWLGEDPDHYVYEPFRKETDSELLAGLLNEFAQAPQGTPAEDVDLIAKLVDVRFGYHLTSLEQRRQTAVWELLNRRYFRRAWIFQEASLARELLVQYGPLEVPFGELHRIFEAYYGLEIYLGTQDWRNVASRAGGFEMMQLIHHSHQRMKNSSRVSSTQQEHLLLKTLFSVLRRVEAFDPRDLIFAFLAFQENEGITATAESYRQTPEQVWTESAELIIKASTSLDLFAAVSGDAQRKLKIPSWVPYWTDCFPYSRPIASPASKFRASLAKQHHWITSDDPGKLNTRGKIVDRISASLGGAFLDFDTPRGTPHLFLSWEVLLGDTRRYLWGRNDVLGDQLAVRLDTLDRDLMRTVLADGAMGLEQPLKCIYEMLYVNSRADAMKQYRKSGRWNLSEEQRNQLLDYEKLEQLVLVAERKRVYITDHFQFALAPSAIQPGDSVAIIHGSKTPCILRKVKNDGAGDRGTDRNEYRLISQCYLDGWMYGRTKHISSHPHKLWWEEAEEEFVLV